MNLKLWRCDDGTYDVLDLKDAARIGIPEIVAYNVTAEYILAGCRFKQEDKGKQMLTLNDLPEGMAKTCRNLLTMRLVACAIDEITADPQLVKLWVGTVVHSGFVGYESMDNKELLDEAERFGLTDLPVLRELDIEEAHLGALAESRRWKGSSC